MPAFGGRCAVARQALCRRPAAGVPSPGGRCAVARQAVVLAGRAAVVLPARTVALVVSAVNYGMYIKATKPAQI